MKGPKVLFIDIETAPLEVYSWGIWNQNIGLPQIINESSILSIAWKWLGSGSINCVTASPNDPRRDIKLAHIAASLIEESDIAVGHNIDKFDLPMLKGRIIVNGISPPSSPRTIDTLKIARKHFRFTSNKLEHLAHILKLPTKKLTTRQFDGFTLWKECLAGNKAAFKELIKYNKQDVEVLEQCYNKLIKWAPNINFDAYYKTLDNVCTCGSTEWHNNGYAYTAKGKFKRYKCKKCGKERKSSKNLLSKTKKGTL